MHARRERGSPNLYQAKYERSPYQSWANQMFYNSIHTKSVADKWFSNLVIYIQPQLLLNYFARYWYLWDRSRHLLDKEIKVNFTLYLIEWKEHVAWRNRSFWFSRWIIISYYTMVAIWGQHISTDLIMCDV